MHSMRILQHWKKERRYFHMDQLCQLCIRPGQQEPVHRQEADDSIYCRGRIVLMILPGDNLLRTPFLLSSCVKSIRLSWGMYVPLEGLCTIRDILERQVSRKLMCIVLVVVVVVLIAGVGVGVGVE